MKPNFYQQLVIIAYMLIFIILCIFFVPFGTDEIYFDSIFSSNGNLVTYRFLTEILVFTIPAVILYKTSANSKNPNFSLFELFNFKTKKSFLLYAVILFIGILYFYIQYKNVIERGKIEKLEAKDRSIQDSTAAAEAAKAAEEIDKAQAEADKAASNKTNTPDQ